MIEQASLVLGNGNWAVKSDSLLGYKTIDGKYYPREMTVTRATTATRVNASGLVELVPYNLLQYSEQFNDAIWGKTNATITANSTTSPDGTLTADTITSTGIDGRALQAPTINGNQDYTFSVWLKSTTSSNVNASIRSVGSPIAIVVTSEWQRFVITQSHPTTATRFPGISGIASGDSVYLWGAQLVEGTEALTYLPTTDRLDIARVDYSTGSPALLVEPGRTNLAFYSQEFSNIYWGSNFTSITKNLLSPSGIVNADTFVNNVGANRSIVRGISVVSGNTYVLSFWIKKISGAFVNSTAIQLSSFGTAVASQTYTDIGTTLTTDWVRYTHTFTATSTNTVFVQLISNEINTIGVWGAQLEAGVYATSYIPTTTASVTRNADVITRNNIYTNGFITASGGTWFVDIKNNIDLIRNGSSGGIFINTGTVALGGTGFLFRNPTSSSQKISIIKYISGTPSTLYDTLTTDVKAAIKWNGTTADVFVNGVKVVTATAFTTTAMENLIADGNNRNLNISTMLLAATPLSDAECIQLTTI